MNASKVMPMDLSFARSATRAMRLGHARLRPRVRRWARLPSRTPGTVLPAGYWTMVVLETGPYPRRSHAFASDSGLDACGTAPYTDFSLRFREPLKRRFD